MATLSVLLLRTLSSAFCAWAAPLAARTARARPKETVRRWSLGMSGFQVGGRSTSTGVRQICKSCAAPSCARPVSVHLGARCLHRLVPARRFGGQEPGEILAAQEGRVRALAH